MQKLLGYVLQHPWGDLVGRKQTVKTYRWFITEGRTVYPKTNNINEALFMDIFMADSLSRELKKSENLKYDLKIVPVKVHMEDALSEEQVEALHKAGAGHIMNVAKEAYEYKNN